MEAWSNDEGIRDVSPELGGSSVQIQLTARHVEVTDDVRNYIQEKVDKLPRFYDRIHEVEVVLDHQSEQFSVEMIVRTDRRHTIVVSETGPDTFALIDVLTDRLERQLTKHKEKNRHHKHDGRAEPPTG
ncbi:MAG: ribosome-associated translation inhibitor RaiA [Planctomycetes bacterium]|nr:ribosome-associated translation inhibitor RaiA [Planctomycetota bacterium]